MALNVDGMDGNVKHWISRSILEMDLEVTPPDLSQEGVEATLMFCLAAQLLACPCSAQLIHPGSGVLGPREESVGITEPLH